MPGNHPDDSVEDCVQDVMSQGHDESSAYAICEASINDKSFEESELATMLKEDGADEWVETVGRLVRSDVESTVIADVVERARSGASRHEAQKAMAKSQKIEKVGFEAEMHSQFTVFKAGDDDFVIWGPASVEIVDKEGDKIQAKALQKALPQLLKRARLSLEHSDQLVGRILERFETDREVAVEIADKKFKRSEFPTDVLELDGMEPALYVAGEIWDDSRQARKTREDIEGGDLNSYSISGEALVTQKRVTSDGDTYDDVVDIDLSAVTLCEEGMNQKAKFARIDEDGTKEAATAKSDTPTTGDAPTERVAQIAKNALSETMSETEKGSDDPDGGFDAQALTSEFKSVLDKKLPDGELATKDDTLTREDVESIAREVYREDDAGEEDDRDEGTSDAEGRPGEEADVSGEEAKGDEEQPGTTKDDALVALANEFDVKEDNILAALKAIADKGSDEDRDGDEDYDEAGEGEEPGPDVDADDEEKAPEDEKPAPEEEEAPAPEEEDDEDPPAPEEEEAPAPEDEKPPAPEDEDKDMSDGYSAEELEERLPSDVYEVVREYLDDGSGGAAPEGGEEEVMASAKEDDIEKAVANILSGSGLEKVEGADAPSGETEKSYDDDAAPESDHGNNPALANFYGD